MAPIRPRTSTLIADSNTPISFASPGWYAIKTTTGEVGLVLHRGTQGFNLGPKKYGQVTSAVRVGNVSQDMPGLLSNNSVRVQKGLSQLGATGPQLRAFMSEATAGAGKQQGHFLGGVLGFLSSLPALGTLVPFQKTGQTTQLLIPGGKPAPGSKAATGGATASSGTKPVSTKLTGNVQAVPNAANQLGGISSTLDFLKWISWLFHPLNLLRAVEFLTGLVTMYYGLHTLLGVMRRGRATHSTTVRSIWAATPMGKAGLVRRARRRGRRAGQIQAERDVAYRGARQERARSVGAEKRRLGETGGTGGTGGTGTEQIQVG